MCHDSVTCVPWLIHKCAMTHTNLCHDSYRCVPWLIHCTHMNESWHTYEWVMVYTWISPKCDTFLKSCVIWLIQMCEVAHGTKSVKKYVFTQKETYNPEFVENWKLSFSGGYLRIRGTNLSFQFQWDILCRSLPRTQHMSHGTRMSMSHGTRTEFKFNQNLNSTLYREPPHTSDVRGGSRYKVD